MIEAEENAGRLVLRLDRPEKANALTGAMLSELARQVRGASEREGIGAVILCGTGRVFSAGADLEEVREGGLATSGLWEDLSSAVEDCPLLTVAALALHLLRLNWQPLWWDEGYSVYFATEPLARMAVAMAQGMRQQSLNM